MRLEADESNRDRFVGPVPFCLKIFALKILWEKKEVWFFSIPLGHIKGQVKIMPQGKS